MFTRKNTNGRRKVSIVTSLSLLFLALAIANLIVTWIFSGANQMRLITEKANLLGAAHASDIEKALTPVFERILANSREKNIKKIEKSSILEALKVPGKPGDLLAPSFDIYKADFDLAISHPDGSAGIRPDTAQYLLKALQLRDMKRQRFLGVPEISDFSIRLFIPLTSQTGNDFVFVTRLSLPTIAQDLTSLLRLIASTIVILLLVQILIGFLIYRILLRPIQAVTRASVQLGNGQFISIPIPKRQNDEIMILIESFNKMTDELRIKDEIIHKQLGDLTDKNQTLDFELEIAERIQKSILPDARFWSENIFSVAYEPLTRVSGDFYDVKVFPDKSVGILIADACGHGVPAAFLTILMKVFFTSLAPTHRDPGMLMKAINSEVARYLEDSGFYLTAFYARIYSDGTIEYCNCGHPPPWLINAQAETQYLSGDNNVIGLFAEIESFDTGRLQFSTGDMLFLFTDGLTELMNSEGEMLPQEHLREQILQSEKFNPTGLLSETQRVAKAFQGGADRSDDLTVLLVDLEEMLHRAGALSEQIVSTHESPDEESPIQLLERLLALNESASYFALLANEHLKKGQIARAADVIDLARKKFPSSIALQNVASHIHRSRTRSHKVSDG